MFGAVLSDFALPDRSVPTSSDLIFGHDPQKLLHRQFGLSADQNRLHAPSLTIGHGFST